MPPFPISVIVSLNLDTLLAETPTFSNSEPISDTILAASLDSGDGRSALTRSRVSIL